MRYTLVANALALVLSFASAQNPYVRAANSVAQFQRMECTGEATRTHGAVMTFRGAMATVSNYCYAALLHPDQVQQLWGEALTMLGARIPMNWETKEASDTYIWRHYVGTFADYMAAIDVIGRPTEDAITLIVLATGEMELDTITGRPLIILGSTRLAVVQGLLRQGWTLDPNQPASASMLRFRADVDLTVLFDDSDVAIGVNYFNSRDEAISVTRTLELMRLAGEGVAHRERWIGDRFLEMHVGEVW